MKLNIKKNKIMVSVPSLHGKQKGKSGNSDILFLGSKITVDSDCSHEI